MSKSDDFPEDQAGSSVPLTPNTPVQIYLRKPSAVKFDIYGNYGISLLVFVIPAVLARRPDAPQSEESSCQSRP